MYDIFNSHNFTISGFISALRISMNGFFLEIGLVFHQNSENFLAPLIHGHDQHKTVAKDLSLETKVEIYCDNNHEDRGHDNHIDEVLNYVVDHRLNCMAALF